MITIESFNVTTNSEKTIFRLRYYLKGDKLALRASVILETEYIQNISTAEL